MIFWSHADECVSEITDKDDIFNWSLVEDRTFTPSDSLIGIGTNIIDVLEVIDGSIGGIFELLLSLSEVNNGL